MFNKIKNTKLFLCFALTAFIFLPTNIFACHISFDVVQGKKDTYSKNDEIVAKVQIVLNHRSCNVEIDKTQLTPNGATIVSATKWKEEKPGVWERKLKIKIDDSKSGQATVKAVRTCTKDGGEGTLSLPVK